MQQQVVWMSLLCFDQWGCIVRDALQQNMLCVTAAFQVYIFCVLCYKLSLSILRYFKYNKRDETQPLLQISMSQRKQKKSRCHWSE